MDRYGGTFGAFDDAYDDGDPFASALSLAVDEPAVQVPPSPVGQDERRMQVRAYNYWAALLGNESFPAIAELDLDTLADFGPYSVLLEFGGTGGIDDPAIRFLGTALAAECGGDAPFARLSDIPGRSLLSRITDHYMQILANQAPIGFEAEFTNRAGANVLYRGILLPFSSGGETIDFILGVINWKQVADAATADALLAAIDAAFHAPIAPYEGKDMDRMLDLTGYDRAAGATPEPADLPTPAFGAAAPLDLAAFADAVHEEDDEDEDEGEAGAGTWGRGFAGFGEEDTVYAVDYGAQGLEDGEIADDVDGVVDPLADEDDAGLGLAALVSRGPRMKQSVALPGQDGGGAPPPPRPAFPVPQAYEPADSEPLDLEDEFAPDAEAAAREPEEFAPTPVDASADGLYDCLAAARELAQTARSSEDRGRKALYQAVARAYDFSLEAAANPADFGELLAENGLIVQERAPMTPIVKLVFGADYDKTRLTEYAAVLGHGHRLGVARGALGELLSRADGGLKGIVRAERALRRGSDAAAATPRAEIRPALARKLRKRAAVDWTDLASEGAEFALVMVRRLPSGELTALGEVPEDIALVERAARRLLG